MTDTAKLIKRLENKAKAGWKCYFIERDYVYDLQNTRDNLREEVVQLRLSSTNVNYEHLKQMFLTLYDKVGELCDCPICFDTMTKELTFIPLCGHLICKNCKDKVSVCPICRKSYL
jgi:hypothetical protein